MLFLVRGDEVFRSTPYLVFIRISVPRRHQRGVQGDAMQPMLLVNIMPLYAESTLRVSLTKVQMRENLVRKLMIALFFYLPVVGFGTGTRASRNYKLLVSLNVNVTVNFDSRSSDRSLDPTFSIL